MGKNSTTRKMPKDRALDVPAEANRDKHMNYLATPEENLLPDPEIQKASVKKKKNAIDPLGTHAPGEEHFPDNPRNLPTENTSMPANNANNKNKKG